MPEVAPVIRAVLEVREGRSDSFSRRGGIVVGVEGGDDDDEGGKGGKERKERKELYTLPCCKAIVDSILRLAPARGEMSRKWMNRNLTTQPIRPAQDVSTSPVECILPFPTTINLKHPLCCCIRLTSYN